MKLQICLKIVKEAIGFSPQFLNSRIPNHRQLNFQ